MDHVFTRKGSVTLKTKFIKVPRSKKAARLAIVNDAIKLLKTEKRFRVMSEYTYCEMDSGEISPSQVEAVLMKSVRSCTVCALGALFVSSVRKYDRLATPIVYSDVFEGCTSVDSTSLMDHLARYFDLAQRGLIEGAFEGFGEAGGYHDRIKSDRTRLLKILLNMRRNGGEFIPTDADLPKRKALA